MGAVSVAHGEEEAREKVGGYEIAVCFFIKKEEEEEEEESSKEGVEEVVFS